MLGCRHRIGSTELTEVSQRKDGVQIQIYCAMIACMLLNLYTGLKPTKAVMEILLWYMLGFADEQDVQNNFAHERRSLMPEAIDSERVTCDLLAVTAATLVAQLSAS
jgi:hypothetical protein